MPLQMVVPPKCGGHTEASSHCSSFRQQFARLQYNVAFWVGHRRKRGGIRNAPAFRKAEITR